MTSREGLAEWPLRTSHRNEKKLIQVVYLVPEVMEFSRQGLVTEIYDYGDPQHRAMIERATKKLGYEVISVTNYDGKTSPR
ncbi:hypothetical protein [Hyphomicrobium sp.]|uniref:hypothetical protein n=1 Tax=Hyphomicrobium sp. TaxID=82 RepID=UPI001D3C3207|nr:hypothetical protein [Hyphomicrobium sp.]MBY0561468.1 hypothetical protein [Hyphomicrobium sp.]